MSKPVDEKIVKMSVDNAGFMSKVRETLSGLTNLSKGADKIKGVDMSKTENGVRGIGKAVDSVKMSGLSNGVETVKAKFSALNAVAISVLSNIANRAVSAGASLVKGLTIEPAMQGLQMYENKLTSIQTILANTQGKENLGSVTKSLDELNQYANKTVYSFQDMTTNMGTFTAAGVDLKTAQTAIKGIGNLAASSGSSTQQAGTAMYQLSQAIASGKVSLMDWNSVVNAGMGGKKFQTALQANAKAMGKNVDASKSFRDSLQDGWLTTDVLMKTLNQFANDKAMLKAATQVKTFSALMDTLQDEMKSGWANTWELVFGDFNEAPKLWTKVSDVLGGAVTKSANARNSMLKDFNDLGGHDEAISGLGQMFTNLGKILGVVQKAFRDVFPPMTGLKLAEIATSFSNLMIDMKPSAATLSKIGQAAKGLFSIFDIGIKVVKLLWNAFTALLPDSLGGGFLDLAAKVGKTISQFDKGFNPTKKFSGGLDMVSKAANGFGKAIGTVLDWFGKFLSGVSSVGKVLGDILGPAVQKIGGAFGKFFKGLSFKDVLGAGGIGGLLLAGKNLGKVSDTIEGFGDKIKGLFKTDPAQLKFLEQFKDILKNFSVQIKAASLLEIGVAVLALAKAMQMIGKLSFQDISKGLEVIAISLVGMTKALDAIGNIKMNGSSMKAAILIGAVATAILVLSGALKVIAGIKASSLAKAMLGLAGTMVVLVAGVNALSKAGGKMKTSSFQLVALAVAVVGLSAGLKILASIKASSLAKGLLGMAAALAELAIFVKVVNNTKMSPTTSAGVLVVSAAMVVMAGALKILAGIKATSMAKGLLTIGGLLAEIAIFAKAINGGKLALASVGMVAVALALNMMIPPIAAFGAMSLKSLAKGLGTIAVALAAMVIAMQGASTGLVGAASIVLVAGALNMLVVPIEAIGHMSLGDIAKGLGGLAAGLAIIAVAGIAMTAGSVGLLAFAVAVGALGLAIGAIGTGIAAFVAAIAKLADMTSKSIANVIDNFNHLLGGVAQIIPNLVKIVVNAVLAMADGIAKAAPRLAEDFLSLIQGLLTAVNNHIGEIVALGLSIVTNLINGIAQGIGPLIDAATNLVINFINGFAESIRDNGPELVTAVLGLVESVLEIVVNALTQVADILLGWTGLPFAKWGQDATNSLRSTFKISDVGAEQTQNYVNAINGGADGTHTAALNIVRSYIAGLSGAKQQAVVQAIASGMSYKDALRSTNPAIAGAAKSMGQTTWTNAKKDLKGVGGTTGSSYVTGVRSKKGSAGNAGKALADAGKGGAGKTDWSSAGKNAGLGFGRGISHAKDAVIGFAQGLASSALGALKKWLKIKSPSRVTMEVGDYFGQGFGKGIDGQGKAVSGQAQTLGQKAVNAIKGVAGQMNDALDGSMNLNPTITPVVDMSNVTGANTDMSGTLAMAGAAGNYLTAGASVSADTYNFGDISVKVTVPDQATAGVTKEVLQSSFDDMMLKALRQVKKG